VPSARRALPAGALIESRERGYALVDVSPGLWRTDLRVVDTIAVVRSWTIDARHSGSKAAGVDGSKSERPEEAGKPDCNWCSGRNFVRVATVREEPYVLQRGARRGRKGR
jgi:hypothetical protein